ncbi:MAG: hypothetical protein MZW92_45750 [Comamonadaceae bacterium]|nr:hypothetical protein [Comamonadaceae bacterium]
MTDAAFWQAVAAGYDGEPLRFAGFCADRMVMALAPRAAKSCSTSPAVPAPPRSRPRRRSGRRGGSCD